MNSSRAYVFVKIFGRTGARMFFVSLGIAAVYFSAHTLFTGRTPADTFFLEPLPAYKNLPGESFAL